MILVSVYWLATVYWFVIMNISDLFHTLYEQMQGSPSKSKPSQSNLCFSSTVKGTDDEYTRKRQPLLVGVK